MLAPGRLAAFALDFATSMTSFVSDANEILSFTNGQLEFLERAWAEVARSSGSAGGVVLADFLESIVEMNAAGMFGFSFGRHPFDQREVAESMGSAVAEIARATTNVILGRGASERFAFLANVERSIQVMWITDQLLLHRMVQRHAPGVEALVLDLPSTLSAEVEQAIAATSAAAREHAQNVNR